MMNHQNKTQASSNSGTPTTPHISAATAESRFSIDACFNWVML
jgi:hypothetical protein